MSKPTKNNWIFVRGLIREQLHWDGFGQQFSQALDAQVSMVDLPGAGTKYTEKSPASIEEIVDHVESYGVPINDKPMIMAHSMGCVVALEWMRRNPGKFSGAVFTNTSFPGICPVFERIRPSALISMAKIAFTHKSLQLRESIKFPLICANESKRDHSVNLWVRIQQEHPVSLATAFNQLRAAKSYRIRQKPTEPILLLSSLGDRLVNPSCSDRISKKWNLPLNTHLWGGHDLFHDDPDWVIQHTKSWVEQLNSNA